MKVVVRSAFADEPDTLEAFANKNGLALELVEHPEWECNEAGEEPWTASFMGYNVLKRGRLAAARGYGTTQEDAVNAYLDIIAGKVLVRQTRGGFIGYFVNNLFKKNKEIRVPEEWADTSFNVQYTMAVRTVMAQVRRCGNSFHKRVRIVRPYLALPRNIVYNRKTICGYGVAANTSACQVEEHESESRYSLQKGWANGKY